MASITPSQESLQVASVIIDNAKDYVVESLGKAKETVVNTIYPTPSDSSTPEPPHGIPPSESCHLGKVAYEDKSITGKISESIQNISSLRRPSLEDLMSNLDAASIPAPPHGTPPSDSCHKGIVADEDKSLLMKVSENWETLKSYTPEVPIALPIPPISAIASLPDFSEYKQEIQAYYEAFPQSFNDIMLQSQRKMGYSYSFGPGVIPPPPHGIPPSDTSRGRVSETDKALTQQLEDNWEMLRSEFLKLWGQSKSSLGWSWSSSTNTSSFSSSSSSESTIPAPPHGIPPSDKGRGFVDDRDKSYVTMLSEGAHESVQNLKDMIARRSVSFNFPSTFSGSSASSGGVPSIPEPPHGIPPSDGVPRGFVAEEDKSLPQKAREAWEQVKEITMEKVGGATQTISNFTSDLTAPITGGYL